MTQHRALSVMAFVPLFFQDGDGGDGGLTIRSILVYILVGIVVGILARLLVPGRDPIGVLGTIVVGVLGAIVGGWLAGALFEETEGVDWIASIIVAVLFVLLLRAVGGRGGWRRSTL
jgi:uncharacterized membrane protein YeaQ/YmgE (transglycosylase-associated protein family)